MRLPDRLPIPYKVCNMNTDDSYAVNRSLNEKIVSGTWNIEMAFPHCATVYVRLNDAYV